MPWKIRIKHAHGQIAVDLPVRTQDNPLVIGRVDECDIVIPTTNVSRQHCFIYVQGEAWVVKDAGSRTGTFINGSKIIRPTLLEPNDVISLGEGADAPSLTMMYIEPAGTTEPAVTAPAEPHPDEAAAEAEPSEDSAIFDAEQIGAATRRYYVPKKKGMSGGAITALIVITILLLGGGGLFWYKLQESRKESIAERAPAQPAPVAAEPVVPLPPPLPPVNEKGRTNIFTDEPVRPATAPKAVATSERRPTVSPTTATEKPAAVAAATPDEPAAEPEVDPRRQTDSWQRVEHARRASKPGEALFIYETYRIDNPKGPFLDEVAAFTEEAFDLLWWYRVRDLMSQIETLRQQMVKLDGDIRIEGDASYKKKLVTERQNRSEELLRSETALKEMNYKQPDPPDVYDADKLAELRKSRDPAYYATWKKKALATLKYSRGMRAF